MLKFPVDEEINFGNFVCLLLISVVIKIIQVFNFLLQENYFLGIGEELRIEKLCVCQSADKQECELCTRIKNETTK